MNTPAGPWPTPGSILFAISLLLLLASMLCLTTAAVRLRHHAAGPEPGLEPRSASDHREQGSHGTRTRIRTLQRVVAATVASVLIAALAPVSASAGTCVVTGLGVCTQLQTGPTTQIPKINTGSGNNQGSQAKSGFKLPTSYAPPKSVTAPKWLTINSLNSPKGAPSPKPHVLVRPSQASQPHIPQVNYIPTVKATPSVKASGKNKQNAGFTTTVTITGQASPPAHAKKKTPYPKIAPIALPWPATATATAHAKKRQKQYNYNPLPITITPTVTPTPSVKPSPGAYPGGFSGPFVFPPTAAPPSGMPPTATPPTDAPPPGYPPVDLPPITLPQNCQLTEAEQQQLIDEATAQHAENEALYQQLLLKALLQQAALKAASALLTQQLSGHTGLSPQDVADLIKNGTVAPPDMAMAALQAASELAQETGGHTNQGTTCDQGTGPGQGSALPPDNGSSTHNNSDPNASGQGQQGQGQSGQQGKGGSSQTPPADLGPDWTPRDPATICKSTGCEDVAIEIQQKIGGTRFRIEDQYGAPTLGQYRGEDTYWAYHEVDVVDGRVYDAWTDRYGEPVDQYISNWQYGKYLKWTPIG